MIQCGFCGFSVTDGMKHSLMSNSCPACGRQLFSNEDMDLLSSIQGGLGSRPFAFNLTEEVIYDMSLFMFNELKYGLGQQLVMKAIDDFKSKSLRAELEEKEPDAEEDPLTQARKEVEKELYNKIEEITESDPDETESDQGDEDIWTKAERLRRLHQQRKASGKVPTDDGPRITANKKTGASVKRIR